MTTAERLARALLARIGYRVETPAEKHARMCAECHPTAKAIRLVQAQWVVAGIDRGE